MPKTNVHKRTARINAINDLIPITLPTSVEIILPATDNEDLLVEYYTTHTGRCQIPLFYLVYQLGGISIRLAWTLDRKLLPGFPNKRFQQLALQVEAGIAPQNYDIEELKLQQQQPRSQQQQPRSQQQQPRSQQQQLRLQHYTTKEKAQFKITTTTQALNIQTLPARPLYHHQHNSMDVCCPTSTFHSTTYAEIFDRAQNKGHPDVYLYALTYINTQWSVRDTSKKNDCRITSIPHISYEISELDPGYNPLTSHAVMIDSSLQKVLYFPGGGRLCPSSKAHPNVATSSLGRRNLRQPFLNEAAFEIAKRQARRMVRGIWAAQKALGGDFCVDNTFFVAAQHIARSSGYASPCGT